MVILCKTYTHVGKKEKKCLKYIEYSVYEA